MKYPLETRSAEMELWMKKEHFQYFISQLLNDDGQHKGIVNQ